VAEGADCGDVLDVFVSDSDSALGALGFGPAMEVSDMGSFRGCDGGFDGKGYDWKDDVVWTFSGAARRVVTQEKRRIACWHGLAVARTCTMARRLSAARAAQTVLIVVGVAMLAEGARSDNSTGCTTQLLVVDRGGEARRFGLSGSTA